MLRTDPPYKIIRHQGQFQILDLEQMAQEPKKRRSYSPLCRITTVLGVLVFCKLKVVAVVVVVTR